METFESRFKRLSEKQSPINTNPLEEGFRSFHLKADGLNLELLNQTKQRKFPWYYRVPQSNLRQIGEGGQEL